MSGAGRTNPMLDLWESALAKQGAAFDHTASDFLSARWLLDHRHAVDVLHFHWTQYHYSRESRAATLFALAKFSLKLLGARLLGYRIVWTMHNALPHESRYRTLDYLGRLVVAHVANSVIVLCEEGRRQLRAGFRRGRGIFVAYHGHYVDAYPNHVSRADAQRILNVGDNQPVFLYFGGVRPYKGIEQLLDAFKALPQPRAALLLVGCPLDESYGAQIERLAQQDRRVRVVLEYVTDESLQIYFNAADIVVLPFARVLASGSVLMALSFRRPVLAPALGCMPEVVAGGTGILYDPNDPGGLGEALSRCMTADLDAMGRAAFDRARQFTWEAVAKTTLEAYGVTAR